MEDRIDEKTANSDEGRLQGGERRGRGREGRGGEMFERERIRSRMKLESGHQGLTIEAEMCSSTQGKV